MDHSREPTSTRSSHIPGGIAAATGKGTLEPMVNELRALAIAGLQKSFDPHAAIFPFRFERNNGSFVRVGHSRRYTAIAAIGLGGECPATSRGVLGGHSVRQVVERLILSSTLQDSIGDLALIAWAGHAVGCSAEVIWERIRALDPENCSMPTVEAAWVLAATAADPIVGRSALASHIARRLCEAFRAGARTFPHYLGIAANRGRAHVSCFADLVYPIHALAQYGVANNDDEAISTVVQAADAMCRNQGSHGQWWWHFDHRTGDVIERYPVYAVHQDAMAPMALFAAARASGTNYDTAIARGLRWLYQAPEIEGGSLIDRNAGIVWRKVGRREPARFSRFIQAGASRLSPHLRAPGLDLIFPPHAIDFEDRPYHLGWVLYAWPRSRAAAWPTTDRHIS